MVLHLLAFTNMAKWPQSGHILALRDLFLLFDRHLKVAGMVEGQRHEYFEITRISTRRDHIRNRHAQFVTKKETIWSVKRSRRGKHRGFFSDLSIRLEIRALALDVASEALQRRPPRITQRTLRLRVLYVCLDPYRALIGSYSDEGMPSRQPRDRDGSMTCAYPRAERIFIRRSCDAHHRRRDRVASPCRQWCAEGWRHGARPWHRRRLHFCTANCKGHGGHRHRDIVLRR